MNVMELRGIAKAYRRTLTGGGPRTLQALGQNPVSGLSRDKHWVLQDISFDVQRGESVGLVGENGSGKSTLLRIMAGVTHADRGSMVARGRISGLLTLGNEMNGLLSGRENIVTAGILAGLSRGEIGRRMDEIADFAELTNVLDQPLRTYSDGMKLRLAFSASVHTDPEILLIDEVLAVGDMAFQEKCLRRLETLREHGATVVFVSHSPDLVLRMTSRAVWLENGLVRFAGDAESVIDQYEQRMNERVGPAEAQPGGATRLGSGEVQIASISLLNRDGRAIDSLRAGSAVTVAIDYVAHEPIEDPIVNVAVRPATGQGLPIDLSTEADSLSVGVLTDRGRITLDLDRLDLANGTYYLDIGLFAPGWERPLDYLWGAVSFVVRSNPAAGPVAPPRVWSVG